MSIFDLADEIAAEHIRWCRSKRMRPSEIMHSIGRSWSPGMGMDDVHDAVAGAWLTLVSPERKAA